MTTALITTEGTVLGRFIVDRSRFLPHIAHFRCLFTGRCGPGDISLTISESAGLPARVRPCRKFQPRLVSIVSHHAWFRLVCDLRTAAASIRPRRAVAAFAAIWVLTCVTAASAQPVVTFS